MALGDLGTGLYVCVFESLTLCSIDIAVNVAIITLLDRRVAPVKTCMYTVCLLHALKFPPSGKDSCPRVYTQTHNVHENWLVDPALQT